MPYKNREDRIEKCKRYYEQNKEAHKALVLDKYYTNREAILEQQREYKRKVREKKQWVAHNEAIQLNESLEKELQVV